MPLSPRLYHWFVRPKWLTDRYIHRHIKRHFRLENKKILDFGCGTGANCCICTPEQYIGIEPDSKRVDLAKLLYPNHNFQLFNGVNVLVEDHSIDLILIVAVLHHIPNNRIMDYLLELRRVLKPDGQIIVMEPCLTEHSKFKNRFMNWFDDGDYIRNEQNYLSLFRERQYDCRVIMTFPKCFLYNEILFSAAPVGARHRQIK